LEYRTDAPWSVGIAKWRLGERDAFHDGCGRQVHAALSEDELEAARREGHSMNWDGAAAYALKVPKA